MVSKMVWGIAWNFIRALKSLKNCTLMSSFCPKYIIFQLKISEKLCVIILKGDAKFKGKLTHGLKNDIKNLVKIYTLKGSFLSKTYKDLDQKV